MEVIDTENVNEEFDIDSAWDRPKAQNAECESESPDSANRALANAKALTIENAALRRRFMQ